MEALISLVPILILLGIALPIAAIAGLVIAVWARDRADRRLARVLRKDSAPAGSSGSAASHWRSAASSWCATRSSRA